MHYPVSCSLAAQLLLSFKKVFKIYFMAFAVLISVFFSQAVLSLTANFPAQDADGNFTISWSGGRTYVQLYVNGNSSAIFGGSGSSLYSYNVTGKPPGSYIYRLSDCLVTGSQNGSTTTCADYYHTVIVGLASPTITAIGNQVISEDSSTSSIPFTINDADTPAASLVVSISSSNVALVPVSNIVLSGTGAARSIILTPTVNSYGVSTITLSVSDGGRTTTSSFLLTVNSINDRPTVSALSNVSVNVGTTSFGGFNFSVGDVETAAGSLSVTATSSNTLLVPLSNMVLGGSGSARTINVQSVNGVTGNSTITVAVSDGQLTASSNFVVTVNATSGGATPLPEFNFQTQAPGSFTYSFASSGIPSLGASQNVATTQGDINVANGAASYTVKLDLPPAVRDLKPKLALSYNSRSGNGLMGVGWNLSGLSAISRCRANFAADGTESQKSNPRYSQGDRLCLDGQKLVLADASVTANNANYWATNTAYKTEIDNFSRIVAYGSDTGAHAYFKVWTKDGRILTYGGEESLQNSRIKKSGKPIGTWALDKVEDAYGNNYTITYVRDIENGDYYPDRINFAPDSAVVFKYQDRQGQTPWGYDMGAKYKQAKVLDTVTTYINVASPSVPEAGTAVKKYDVNYKLSTGTQRELVDVISECGYQAGAWKCAKPLTFDWQAGELGFDETTPHQINYCAGGVANVVQFIDIDGDGYNDAFQKNGAIAWGTSNSCFVNGDWVTNGLTTDSVQPIMTKGGYALALKQTNKTTNPYTRTVGVIYNINKSSQTKTYVQIDSDITDTGVVITSDLNNDALDDFIYKGKYFIQQDSLIPNFTSQSSSYSDKFKAGSMMMDINGDGIKEEVATNVNYEASNGQPLGVYVNVGGYYGSWKFEANQTQPYEVGQTYYAQSIKTPGGLYRTMADINGDGLKDYIYNHINKNSASPNFDKGEWLYRLNMQTGGVGPEVNTQIVSAGGGQWVNLKNHYSYPYDYDKDGREDLLAVIPSGANECQLRILLARDQAGAMQFQEAAGVVLRFLNGTACTPLYSETQSNVFTGDANNDGIQDANYAGTIFYGKIKQPDLLVKVTDGFNAEVALEYSTLTGDSNNGKPLYTPDSAVPTFPQTPASRSMQVVKKVSVSNGQGGYNNRFYNYAGAKTDMQGRGFLGFANIQTTDTASGVITSTDYRQSFPYVGRIDNATTKTTSGDLISSTKNVYAVHANNARFPYVDYSLQKNYQLTTTDLNNPLSATKVKNTYDACGNLTEQISDTGSGLSGALVTGVLSHLRVANDVNYYGTADCSDDFVYRTTKEASKTSVSDDLRVTVTELEPNSAKEVGKITAFKGTPLQKITVIDRAVNGVVTGSSEVASDIDGATTATRAITSTDLVKGLFPQTITNTLSSGNHVTTVGYDYRFGLESSISLPNSQTTNRTYDYLGRLTEESQGDGTHSEIISFYCSSAPVGCPVGAYYGVATKVTNTNLAGVLGAPLTIVYFDGLQREVRRSIYSMDGKAINTDTVHRPDGKLSAVSEPFVTTGGSGSASYWTNYSNYDALGRPHTVTGADSGSQATHYEKYGTSLKVTDTVTVIGPRTTDTQITQRYINPIGQVAQVIDANNTPVDYTYNSTGNLEATKVNNNINTLVSIGYDSQGNKNHIVDPDAGVIDFDYNGFGELRRQIWQKNTSSAKSMVLAYDQLGRQTSRVDQPVTGSPTAYTWVWDTKQKGLLTSESGNGQAITYGYDGLARLKTLTTSIAGLTDRNFVYDYDNFSRPTKVTYPNGFSVSRQYHAAGMAVQTMDVTDSANPRVLWALGNDLDARGNFNNQLWGNGVVTQTGFDGQNGQLKTIKSGRLTSTSLSALKGDIQALSYEYDTIGNLHSRTSQRTNAAGVALENIREEFAYDKLNRLKTSTTSGLFARFNDYNYNELGNLTSRTSKLGSSTVNDDVGVLSYVPTTANNAGVHAVTAAGGQTYQYDKYGNMTKRGADTIDYNVFNKPTRISGGGNVTTIDYDANHERFREVNGSTVTYTFAGGVYEEVVEGTKTTQKSYVDGVILNTKVFNSGVEASNDTLYLHTDNLGSVEAISDKLGAFVSRMSFSDWGKRQQSDWKTGSPTGSFPTANGYTGHHQLDQHKLVHMGGRVYDPGLGRFLSADLFVQSPYSSQSFNRYSYAFNSPLKYVDPSGYCNNASKIYDEDMNELPSYDPIPCDGEGGGGGFDPRGNNQYEDNSQKETQQTLDLYVPEKGSSPCPSCHGPAPDGAETTNSDREFLASLACSFFTPCALDEFIKEPNLANSLGLLGTYLPGLKGAKGLTLEQQAAKLVERNGGRNSVTILTPNGHVRVDLAGKAHNSKELGVAVPTPHAQHYTNNVIPKGPRAGEIGSVTKNGDVVPGSAEMLRMIDGYFKSIGK